MKTEKTGTQLFRRRLFKVISATIIIAGLLFSLGFIFPTENHVNPTVIFPLPKGETFISFGIENSNGINQVLWISTKDSTGKIHLRQQKKGSFENNYVLVPN